MKKIKNKIKSPVKKKQNKIENADTKEPREKLNNYLFILIVMFVYYLVSK